MRGDGAEIGAQAAQRPAGEQRVGGETDDEPKEDDPIVWNIRAEGTEAKYLLHNGQGRDDHAEQKPRQHAHAHDGGESGLIGLAAAQAAPHREQREGHEIEDEDAGPGQPHHSPRSAVLKGVFQPEAEEEEIHGHHERGGSSELTQERKPLAAQNIRHAQRRGEEQFQGTTAPVFAEASRGFHREPAFERAVREQRGPDVHRVVQPTVALLGQAEHPKGCARAQPQPDEHDFESVARSQPVEGIHFEQLPAKGGAYFFRSVGPEPPAFAAAHRMWRGRTILPDERQEQSGEHERQPAERVVEGERDVEPVELRLLEHLLIRRVKGEHAGEAGAG